MLTQEQLVTSKTHLSSKIVIKSQFAVFTTFDILHTWASRLLRWSWSVNKQQRFVSWAGGWWRHLTPHLCFCVAYCNMHCKPSSAQKHANTAVTHSDRRMETNTRAHKKKHSKFKSDQKVPFQGYSPLVKSSICYTETSKSKVYKTSQSKKCAAQRKYFQQRGCLQSNAA